MSIDVTLFTDPACPFAFSAETVRRRLRWLYGDALIWTPRMIVLTREPGEAEKLAEGGGGLQERYGMPIAPGPYQRPASSEPACRAVVAARQRAGPQPAERLLRRLRVLVMQHGLLDDPDLIARAVDEAGLGESDVRRTESVERALEADIAAARNPAPAARALDHKLGGPIEARRYTAPSYELRRGDTLIAIPGFQPVDVYETAIANIAPDLQRRPKPNSVAEVIDWAGDEPLATAEVAEIMQLDDQRTRSELAKAAHPEPAAADFYWHRT